MTPSFWRIPHRNAAWLRLGQPSALNNVMEHALRKLGMPTTSLMRCHGVRERGLCGMTRRLVQS
jgi:hypothetical protein